MTKHRFLDAIATQYGESDPTPVYLRWHTRHDAELRAKGTVNIPEGVSIITGFSRKKAAVQVERTKDVCRITIIGPVLRPRYEARGVLLEPETRQRYIEHIERHGRAASASVIGDWLFTGDAAFLRGALNNYPGLGELIDFFNANNPKGRHT